MIVTCRRPGEFTIATRRRRRKVQDSKDRINLPPKKKTVSFAGGPRWHAWTHLTRKKAASLVQKKSEVKMVYHAGVTRLKHTCNGLPSKGTRDRQSRRTFQHSSSKSFSTNNTLQNHSRIVPYASCTGRR